MSTRGKDAEIFNLGVTLQNIPGREYVFGSSLGCPNIFPKTIDKDERFILCPFPNVAERHCKIFVDEDGEFCIQKLDNSAEMFINREQLILQHRRKLNFGDIISFGGSQTAFIYFELKEVSGQEVRMSANMKDAEIFNLGAILLNIPDQEYVFGSSYHKINDKEHVTLCPFPNVEGRHFNISVDKDGDFWITSLNSAKTSINQEPLQGKAKLNFGDIISFGAETTAFVYCEFKERREIEALPSPWEERELHDITPFPPIASVVGYKHEIVQSILKNFSVEEIQRYRFVSKDWNYAGSQLLRKRCAVSIPDSCSYEYEQTKLFRCSKEMENFASTMTSLSVEIPTFFPERESDAEKFVDDLVKYQLKGSLTYIKLTAWMLTRRGDRAILLDKILQKVSQLCPNLEHLFLKISLNNTGVTLPPDSEWSFGPKLKTLEILEWRACPGFARSILQKIDTAKLEKFVSRGSVGSKFLDVLLEKDLCNLKEISLLVESCVREEGLKTLERLPPNIPLQTLVLNEIFELDLPRVSRSLSNVLEKFSKTLVSLTMTCRGGNIVLPRFEKLEDLSLFYDEDTELTFPPQFLYATNFPKLKSLTLNSRKIRGGEDVAFSEYTKAEALAQWGLNEGLFNSFAPSGQVCSSLEVLDIPHSPPESYEENQEYEDRLQAMRTLFPNVKGKWIKAGT